MAIHPKLSPSPSPAHHQQHHQQRQPQETNLTPQQATEISVWTEQASQSLRDLHISTSTAQTAQSPTPPARNSSSNLVIPLDVEHHHHHHHHAEQTPTRLRAKNVRVEGAEAKDPTHVVYRRREPIRRDSLKRREALLKGKEGSRRRQRWENDRFLSNPWAQAPSDHDWQVQPTHPRHETMPYYLAPLWDAHYAAKEQARVSRRKAHARAKPHKDDADGAESGGNEMHQIPKELRVRLKHARAARGMLQDLEDDIREFLQNWNSKQMSQTPDGQARSSRAEAQDSESADTDTDDDEDEVVFAGRKHAAKQPPRSGRDPTLDESGVGDCEKLVFESSADDHGAGFGRWLVHSLASYYGLRTWSVTVGDPPRREAYVGIDPIAFQRWQGSASSVKMGTGHPAESHQLLPRPLYVSV